MNSQKWTSGCTQVVRLHGLKQTDLRTVYLSVQNYVTVCTVAGETIAMSENRKELHRALLAFLMNPYIPSLT